MNTPLPTAHQRAVADAALAQESAQRRHLVVHLSGAHAFGFPSHDSDLDLKAVHIEATRHLVGLTQPRVTFNRLEVIDGVEIDYTSNELSMGLSGVLKGDGNMLERLLSRQPVAADSALTELQPLVRAALSQRFARHYLGYARGQAKQLRDADLPKAKTLLYVLRTAVTGTHLLLEGACEPDLTALHERYKLPEVPELVHRKASAERGALDESWRERIEPLLARALSQLDDARSRSPLPSEPTAQSTADLQDWMLQVRREYW